MWGHKQRDKNPLSWYLGGTTHDQPKRKADTYTHTLTHTHTHTHTHKHIYMYVYLDFVMSCGSCPRQTTICPLF